jgi:hypothetical protein
MILQIRRSAARNSVTISDLALKDPSTALRELIEEAAKSAGRPVVVLIDEYDKPLLDFITETEKAEKVRVALRNFYTQIKAADAWVRFIFITGISKFSRMGVFSALNNLEDISMNARYSTMLGYTEDELHSYFSAYIDETALAMKKNRDDLILEVRDYYDGFSFDGENHLYNPFSTLNFFK